jgi:hypothetical protein
MPEITVAKHHRGDNIWKVVVRMPDGSRWECWPEVAAVISDKLRNAAAECETKRNLATQ